MLMVNCSSKSVTHLYNSVSDEPHHKVCLQHSCCCCVRNKSPWHIKNTKSDCLSLTVSISRLNINRECNTVTIFSFYVPRYLPSLLADVSGRVSIRPSEAWSSLQPVLPRDRAGAETAQKVDNRFKCNTGGKDPTRNFSYDS